MTKEVVHLDFTMKTFDTSKMDMWSEEQWKEWRGDSEEDIGIKILLMNDHTLYLKIMEIYYDEATGDMFFGFDAQNKLDRAIHIQFGSWKIDESTNDLSHIKPQHLEKHSVVRGFQRFVKRTYLESWDSITIEINILDAETNENIRELEFQINKRLIQVF
ncbi:hypothetical protein MHZ95_12785 [Sporosarcina sp. ACRSM]|uniref:hypothetical protein n=1 Tax=Sporosarcina sp. ACRSM TaxID=2918216 RepID=UPI001EF5BF8C|nr:hypothetical protein [Sporosarcina sp. ACRSM]MCG7336140.1 hypothetical protein [Sporosarcina sp. ACRSM]